MLALGPHPLVGPHLRGVGLEVLDPDVVLRVDRGAKRPGLLVWGADAVLEQAGRYAGGARFARPALVNGAPGFVVVRGGRPVALAGFAGAGGKIVEMDVIADRARLAELDLAILDD